MKSYKLHKSAFILAVYSTFQMLSSEFYLCIPQNNLLFLKLVCYFKKPRLRIIAGSFALPLQIWKKQIILITQRTIKKIPPAIGTISVKKSTADTIPTSTSTARNYSPCLKWNAT